MEEMKVCGFLFHDEKQAALALKESQKIQYLEAKIDYGELRKVQAIYEKAIQENVFETVVGLYYLKGIRDFLIREEPGYEELLPPVPDPVSGLEPPARTKTARNLQREKQQELLKEKDSRFFASLIINIILVIAIAVMFVITLKAEQPNILNYEKVLTNRYAAWEQELTRREQAVRERELKNATEE